jgi:hypothetical protein
MAVCENEQLVNTRSAALRFVVMLGVVSLFSDMTYEGARVVSGPLLVAWALALGSGYRAAFVILAFPAGAAILTLLAAQRAFPRPERLEVKRLEFAPQGFPRIYWWYLAAAGLTAAAAAGIGLWGIGMGAMESVLRAAIATMVAPERRGSDCLDPVFPESPATAKTTATNLRGCQPCHKYGTMKHVKTTLEIPDAIFRRAKARAAEEGIPLRQLVSEAVGEKLSGSRGAGERPWVKLAGGLRHLRKESTRIRRMVEEEFERIEPEDR